MVISPKFIWIHIPRTGGTWTRALLQRTLPPELLTEVRYPGHNPIYDVDESLRNVPIFWFVRNPWDWHVSRYHFWRMHWGARTGGYLQPRAQWNTAETWWDLTLAKHDNFAAALPSMLEFRPLSFWIDTRTTLNHVSVGTPGRYETLRTNLMGMLREALGDELPAPLAEAIRSEAPTNASPHGPYQGYYDERLRRLVAERERSVIERWGYEF